MNKYVKAGVIVLVLFLLFFPTLIALKYVAIRQVYFHYVGTIADLTGLNTFLVKAISALLLVPFIISVRYLFSLDRTRRTIGSVIIILYVFTYNLSLYHFTKNHYFKFATGEGMKWYALTPEGVKFYDKPGVDPIYGITLQQVTPEIIKNLKLIEKGEFNPIDPDTATFFNPITGEVKVWYFRYADGIYEFYDKPGYHPITGKALKPVTHQVLSEWKAFKEQQTEIEKQRKIEAARKEALAREEEEKRKQLERQTKLKKERKEVERQKQLAEARKREKRLKELRSLVNPSNVSHDTSNVAVAIMSEKSGSAFVQTSERVLPDLLKANNDKYNIIDHYFTQDFKQKGYFVKVFNGNVKLLKEMDAFARVDYIILGKVNVSFKSEGIVEGIISCNINFTFKVFDKTGVLVDSGAVSVIGPGYSEKAALRRGLEMIVEKDSNRIFRNIF